MKLEKKKQTKLNRVMALEARTPTEQAQQQHHAGTGGNNDGTSAYRKARTAYMPIEELGEDFRRADSHTRTGHHVYSAGQMQRTLRGRICC